MIYSHLEDALYAVTLVALSEFTDPVCIFSHLNGTEPAESFVIINILSNTQQGHHTTSTLTDTQEILATQASYEVFVQFSFCGSKSGEMSSSFNQRINNNHKVFEELAKNNMGVMRKSPMRRAPQKRDTKWVEYHNLDVTFSYTVVTQELVDVIEVVILQDIITGDVFTVPPDIVTP